VSCDPQQASSTIASRLGPVACDPKTDCRDSIATRRTADRPDPAADIDEALRAGWLELWYQPKFGSQTLDLCGAEALIRMHHPKWGIVQPAGFMSGMRDLHCRALSQFVVDQAITDWHFFLTEQRQLDLSINLPIWFLDDPACVEYLSRRLPEHPDFAGLIVEIDGAEVVRELAVARAFAKRARLDRIAIAIDRLGGDWSALDQMRDFPFVEIKVDRELVSGCASDRSKQRLCRHIIELASQLGARTVAVGVENQADFVAARELGFDLIQGFLFAKPLAAESFLRSLGHRRSGAL
jgi:EAL domain-containing protein (putative c-di-GMP-specific phosphodiesterase class I)